MLPIFAWVEVMCQEIGGGHNIWTVWLVMTTSVFSYGLMLLHRRGFEFSLAMHVGGVVVWAWWTHLRSPVDTVHIRRRAFFRAVSCCVGFVFLKLADRPLADLFPMLFSVLSGSCWSKVADFMQVHYSAQFIEAILQSTKTVSRDSQKLS